MVLNVFRSSRKTSYDEILRHFSSGKRSAVLLGEGSGRTSSSSLASKNPVIVGGSVDDIDWSQVDESTMNQLFAGDQPSEKKSSSSVSVGAQQEMFPSEEASEEDSLQDVDSLLAEVYASDESVGKEFSRYAYFRVLVLQGVAVEQALLRAWPKSYDTSFRRRFLP